MGKTGFNIEELVNTAVDMAIKKYKEKEREERKKARLHNTELLLKNYTSFVEYYNNAKDDIHELNDLIDIDTLNSDDVFILSIRRSRMRTMIMISHIEAAMDDLKKKMVQKGQAEKYDVIVALYIEGKSFEQIAEEMHCSEITARRWKNEMINELSLKLFGVDGLKLEI